LHVSVSASQHREICEYWHERFGVSFEALYGYRFVIRGKTVWAITDLPGLDEILAGLKIETAGLPFLRRRGHAWKPTTAALLLFHDAVAANVVDLPAGRLDAFLRGEVLSGPFAAERGYVAVRSDGGMLGCGLLGLAGLKSQLPRPWVEALIGGRGDREEDP